MVEGGAEGASSACGADGLQIELDFSVPVDVGTAVPGFAEGRPENLPRWSMLYAKYFI